MSDFPKALPRSPLLMSRHDSALLIVDMQDTLLHLIPHFPRITWNIRRLIDAAKILGLPVAGTEQYPQGLGPTAGLLAQRLGELPAKTRFSCGECREIFSRWSDQGVSKVLIVGIETHVCVQQTVLDLITAGFDVYCAVDATGARHEVDHTTALRRIEVSGAFLTTAESAMFEWCEVAGTAEFKQISTLVKEPRPE